MARHPWRNTMVSAKAQWKCCACGFVNSRKTDKCRECGRKMKPIVARK